MSLMKRFICSIFILLFSFLLVSCETDIKMYAYIDDYNLINEDLEVTIYTTIYNNPYMNIDNVVNTYLLDKENIFIIELLSINYLQKEGDLFCYKYTFDMSIFKEEQIMLIEPIIKIEYINQTEISYALSSLCLYNTSLSNDISLLNMQAVFDGYLKGIIFELKNNTCNYIEISNLKLINAYFEADLLNLMVINSHALDTTIYLENYNPYKSSTNLLQNITLKPYENIMFLMPICYERDIKGNQSAIVITYYINGQIHYKGIYNFVYFTNQMTPLGEYYVTNRNS